MRLALLACLILLALPGAAPAASPPDAGRAWEPTPVSTARYGTRAATDQHVVEAADGVDLFVETWLPEAKGGAEPPAKLPTILIATPYVTPGAHRYTTRNDADVIEYFTQRGYAVAQHHIRGTGSSGGCLEQTADSQIDDVARVIEWLGRDAAWSDGNVGMYGISYDGETQVSVAGRGDPAKIKYLKAIIPAETVGGQYEYSNMDGVPYPGQALLSNTSYQLTVLETSAPDPTLLGRASCLGELYLGSADQTGSLTPFWARREYRPGAGNFTAATLWLHGLADWNVDPITVAGFYDRLPAGLPRKAILGQINHNYPDNHQGGMEPDWERPDWLPTALAWYDRYLKGLDSGVEAWPPVQVQGSDGQWREEADYPTTGGPAGHLALGPEGVLGASAPEGLTVFTEGPDDTESVPGTSAVFETAALGSPLHLTGMPVLDLWLTTSLPDAHLAAKVEVLGADGEPLVFEGSEANAHGTYGARSLQHLAPMPNGYFEQAAAEPAPTGTPIRVPLRLQPVDLVVPQGATLRVTISGALSSFNGAGTAPSGGASEIALLHDCEHMSALRFLTARAEGPYLNVREADEEGALASNPAPAKAVDGGGVASAPVCGRAPERLASFGPERTTPRPGDPPPGCTDAASPRTSKLRVRLRRRSVAVSGRVTDAACGAAGRVRSVRVAVARQVGRRCAFLRRGGRLGTPRRCRVAGAPLLRPRGTASFRMARKARLPRGRYRVWVRAADAAGNRAVRVKRARLR
jgi:X-Pro dipeptidyl-peptidase